ncbi:MAG: hypothetical protein LBI54_02290 [Lachnospiraceae bacterium]|nr:hypothetical protein [Lachnospiraceae bacterium]
MVFAKANLGKYMPGNVMHYVGRNLFGASLGLSQPQIAFGSMVEVAFQLVTASIWVLVLAGKGAGRYLLQLYAQISAPLTYVFAVAIVFASCVAVFTILLKNGYVIKIINFFKNKSFTGLALQLFLYNSIGFFVGALILMVMMWWSAPFEGSAISIVISAYIFSWTVGFLIPGAPAGMGVREAVLLFMLADVCGAEIVLPAAVIQRVIYIFGDVLAFLFCLALSHKQSAS